MIAKIEAVITVIFLIEVSIRMVLSKGRFFSNMWNIVDLTNLVAITLMFGISHLLSKKYSPYLFNEDLPLILLGLRYLSQVLRIILEIKATQDIREAAKLDFTFDHHDEEVKDRSINQPVNISIQ